MRTGALVGGGAVATGVEAPRVGSVAVLSAAVWAYRADETGRWASLAGAVGAAVTLLVHPRVDDQPARGVAVSRHQRTSPSPDGAGLVVAVNPSSGSGTGATVASRVAEALPEAELRECNEGTDFETVLDALVGEGRALGVIGGDGTVNAAVRTALQTDVPLVVFPGGTLNHFAVDLGVDHVEAAVEAVRGGHVHAIDVGIIADRPFVNNASIGSYAELVDERERLEGRLGKWLAMLLALFRVLRRGRRLEVEIDGERRQIWMAFFGNCTYEPIDFAPTTRSDLVDGVLDVCVVAAEPPWSRVRFAVAVLFGGLDHSRVFERWQAPGVRVAFVPDRSDERTGDDTVRLAADGETFDGPATFVVGKRPAALRVLAAADS